MEALMEKTKLINFGLRTECKLIACVYRCNCLLGPPSVCHHCYPHLSLSLSLFLISCNPLSQITFNALLSPSLSVNVRWTSRVEFIGVLYNQAYQYKNLTFRPPMRQNHGLCLEGKRKRTDFV
jgi:hypothetical protein